LYILLSILLLVLPLSNVAYAQSTTIPGPIDELIASIEEAIDKVQEQIREAYDEFCLTRTGTVPGEPIFNCPIILRGALDPK